MKYNCDCPVCQKRKEDDAQKKLRAIEDRLREGIGKFVENPRPQTALRYIEMLEQECWARERKLERAKKKLDLIREEKEASAERDEARGQIDEMGKTMERLMKERDKALRKRDELRERYAEENDLRRIAEQKLDTLQAHEASARCWQPVALPNLPESSFAKLYICSDDAGIIYLATYRDDWFETTWGKRIPDVVEYCPVPEDKK